MASIQARIVDRPLDGSRDLDRLHDGILPANIREGEPVRAIVEMHGSDGQQGVRDLRVWRISPIGGEFLIEDEISSLSLERPLDIRLSVGTKSAEFTGLVVSVRSESRWGTIIGVRWCELPRDRYHITSNQEERTASRWKVNEEFCPTAVVANPLEFNDIVVMRMVDVSSGGAQFKTSLRNKFLIPGMRFEAVVTFPMIGAATLPLQIVWTKVVSESGRDYLAIGASLTSPTRDDLTILGQYVFQFGDAESIDAIRASGLKIKDTSGGVAYKWIRTKEEYLDILKLRAKCYHWVTANSDDGVVAMSDEHDSRARILSATYRGRVVGSLRMSFPRIGDRLEQQCHTELQIDLPPNSQLVEVTRICTDPEFRRSNLLLNMLKRVIIASVNAKRMIVLGSSPGNMIDVYRKMGATITDIKYDIEDHNMKDIYVIYWKISELLAGKGVRPAMWNMLWREPLNHLKSFDAVQLRPPDELRTRVYSYIGKFHKLFGKGV